MPSPTIIVPFRDRALHLSIFVPAMREYLPDAHIVIVEQADDKPFNRGKLLNCGFMETNPDYFIAHDVDMLPIDVDYSYSPVITQLAKSDIQRVDYLGGVTLFPKEVFKEVGGYHGDFFSRAEDNELMFNLKRLHIPSIERCGTFRQLPHERKGPEFIEALWIKAQRKRQVQNQLNMSCYELISRRDEEGCVFIKVKL